MSDVYTAAQEAERVATQYWISLGMRSFFRHPQVDEPFLYEQERAACAACLAAAEACEALSAAITRCDHDCLHQTRSDIVQAIADDYAARAVAWRKATGGESA